MRALRSSPRAGVVGGGLIGDEHELRVAADETHLDVGVAELAREAERRLGEHVEQPQSERWLDRVREPSSCLGDPLVAERRRGLEVATDGLDVQVDVHVVKYDIILMSVKCREYITRMSHPRATDSVCAVRLGPAPAGHTVSSGTTPFRGALGPGTCIADATTCGLHVRGANPSREHDRGPADEPRRPAGSHALADAAPPLPALVGATAAGRARARVRARLHPALAAHPGADPAHDRRRDRRPRQTGCS